MLDHLAEGGHVERARLERDRRVVVSRLTPRGRQAIEAKRAKWQGRWEQALAEVDVEELRVATRVLTRLQAVFDDGLLAADSEYGRLAGNDDAGSPGDDDAATPAAGGTGEAVPGARLAPAPDASR